jgi:hypothetical protein
MSGGKWKKAVESKSGYYSSTSLERAHRNPVSISSPGQRISQKSRHYCYDRNFITKHGKMYSGPLSLNVIRLDKVSGKSGSCDTSTRLDIDHSRVGSVSISKLIGEDGHRKRNLSVITLLPNHVILSSIMTVVNRIKNNNKEETCRYNSNQAPEYEINANFRNVTYIKRHLKQLIMFNRRMVQ